MLQSLVLPRYDLPRASRALAALLRNPDDLPQVFALLDAISGTAPHRMLRRFKRSETGERLLQERPNIAPLLCDREALRSLPDGTLGREYVAFVESEGISAQGIRDASREGRRSRPRNEDFAYLYDRMRDTHDLWHVVTGYKGDVIGELALLAFTLAQHWNAGLALIVAAGLLRGLGVGQVEMTTVVRDGFRRGRSAAWLPAQPWESFLRLPLQEVCARLELGPPPKYTPIRTEELRAKGILF